MLTHVTASHITVRIYVYCLVTRLSLNVNVLHSAFLVIEDHSQRFYTTVSFTHSHTHSHTNDRKLLLHEDQPYPFTHIPPSGATWGSVCCPRTLRHVAQRSRDRTPSQPSNWETTRSTTEPQPLIPFLNFSRLLVNACSKYYK